MAAYQVWLDVSAAVAAGAAERWGQPARRAVAVPAPPSCRGRCPLHCHRLFADRSTGSNLLGKTTLM